MFYRNDIFKKNKQQKSIFLKTETLLFENYYVP